MMADSRDLSKKEASKTDLWGEYTQEKVFFKLPQVNFGISPQPGLDALLSFSFANMIYAPPKPLMQNSQCPHPERKHYAKNMCSACYHKTARPSRAWKCQHRLLPLYAKGRCHDCYVTYYYGRKSSSS